MIEKLTFLKGKTFDTLARDSKFTIEDVTPSGIFITVHSTGNDRQIFRKEIENAWEELLQNGMLFATQVLASGSRSSAYIVTILSKLPDVTYTLKPIRLEYKRRTK